MRPRTFDFINRLHKVDFPNYVISVVLFGSEVYGTPNCFSDIDLGIVVPKNISLQERLLVEELLESLEPPFPLQCVYVSYTDEKLPDKDVRRQIFEKGVKVY